jgi:hypothetical protein
MQEQQFEIHEFSTIEHLQAGCHAENRMVRERSVGELARRSQEVVSHKNMSKSLFSGVFPSVKVGRKPEKVGLL